MTNVPTKKAPHYHASGVNLETAEKVVERYKPHLKRTTLTGVIDTSNAFSALFSLKDANLHGFDDPILVSSTDGVGTKLRLAINQSRHSTIGIDCVAMCVNDVLTSGATPLFFLNYIATGTLNPHQISSVVAGMADGCIEAQCSLVGGETAEMPGFYRGNDYDIAGFCVGFVERAAILGSHRVRVGDNIIGLASSGCHSNGYSLIRDIVTTRQLDLNSLYPALSTEQTLSDILLRPTRIYTAQTHKLLKQHRAHALAHITGGGIYRNLQRVIPDNLCGVINLDSWNTPRIFDFIKHHGSIPDDEMLQVFNMGIGMIIISPDDPAAIIDNMRTSGCDAWLIGHIEQRATNASKVRLT